MDTINTSWSAWLQIVILRRYVPHLQRRSKPWPGLPDPGFPLLGYSSVLQGNRVKMQTSQFNQAHRNANSSTIKSLFPQIPPVLISYNLLFFINTKRRRRRRRRSTGGTTDMKTWRQTDRRMARLLSTEGIWFLIPALRVRRLLHFPFSTWL